MDFQSVERRVLTRCSFRLLSFVCHAFILLHQKISKHRIVVARLLEILLDGSLSWHGRLLPGRWFCSRASCLDRLLSIDVAFVIVTRQKSWRLVGTVTWLLKPCLRLGMCSTLGSARTSPGPRCLTRLAGPDMLHCCSSLPALTLFLAGVRPVLGKLFCYSGRCLMPVLLRLLWSPDRVCCMRLRFGILARHVQFKCVSLTKWKVLAEI